MANNKKPSFLRGSRRPFLLGDWTSLAAEALAAKSCHGDGGMQEIEGHDLTVNQTPRLIQQARQGKLTQAWKEIASHSTTHS
eukprot:6252538-Amphidinium_carterae.1